MLPGTVMYVYIGSTLKSLADVAGGKTEASVPQNVFFGIALIATVVVTVLVARLARKALRDAVPELPKAEEIPPQGDGYA